MVVFSFLLTSYRRSCHRHEGALAFSWSIRYLRKVYMTSITKIRREKANSWSAIFVYILVLFRGIEIFVIFNANTFNWWWLLVQVLRVTVVINNDYYVIIIIIVFLGCMSLLLWILSLLLSLFLVFLHLLLLSQLVPCWYITTSFVILPTTQEY